MEENSPFVQAGCLPGIGRAYSAWAGRDQTWDDIGPEQFDTRIPADRDFLSRVLAAVLGLSVGACAPCFRRHFNGVWTLVGFTGRQALFGPNVFDDGFAHFPGVGVPSLAEIASDDPDADAKALAAVVRWVVDEVKAGRIVDGRGHA